MEGRRRRSSSTSSSLSSDDGGSKDGTVSGSRGLRAQFLDVNDVGQTCHSVLPYQLALCIVSLELSRTILTVYTKGNCGKDFFHHNTCSIILITNIICLRKCSFHLLHRIYTLTVPCAESG